tara:strand:- start:3219 stop:4088 length:870 start_codon:yes stop_codon:yes gene_type:complete
MISLNDRFSYVGNTPLMRLGENLWAKLETFSLTGSVKDRLISFILARAISRGDIDENSVLVEATSGNTGISLAAHGAKLGLKVKIIMPKNMSAERKQMMSIYGAEIIEVGDSDFEGAIVARNNLVASNTRYWSPNQFENLDNILCHRLTTAPEISSQLPPGVKWEAFVSGAGTGGTIMGVQQYVNAVGSLDTKVIMVMPAEDSKKHGIQGINDGADFLVDHTCIDESISIKTTDAKNRARRLASENGLLVGISAGANVLAAEMWIRKNKPKGAVVTILCDRGERYLSIL